MPSIPVFPTSDSAIKAVVPPRISFPTTESRVDAIRFPEISLRKGFPKEATDYNADEFVFLIGQMYLLAKYGGKCIIAEPVRVVLKLKGAEIDSADPFEEPERSYSAEFAVEFASLNQQLKACFDKHATVIFMELQIDIEILYEKTKKHSNLLIYRPYKKTVERYEPHGYAWDNNYADNLVDEKVAHLFESSLDLGRFTPVYKPAYLLNSRFGLGMQMLQSSSDSNDTKKGYCQVWSLFMMETVLMNPIQNTVDIVNACFRFVDNDPQLALDLIRDYWNKIVEDNEWFKFKDARVGTPYFRRLQRKVNIMMQHLTTLPEEAEPALVADEPLLLDFAEVVALRSFVNSLPPEDLRTLGRMFGMDRVPHLIHHFLQNGYTAAMVEDLLRPESPKRPSPEKPKSYLRVSENIEKSKENKENKENKNQETRENQETKKTLKTYRYRGPESVKNL
jgi:hypothetical protein